MDLKNSSKGDKYRENTDKNGYPAPYVECTATPDSYWKSILLLSPHRQTSGTWTRNPTEIETCNYRGNDEKGTKKIKEKSQNKGKTLFLLAQFQYRTFFHTETRDSFRIILTNENLELKIKGIAQKYNNFWIKIDNNLLVRFVVVRHGAETMITWGKWWRNTLSEVVNVRLTATPFQTKLKRKSLSSSSRYAGGERLSSASVNVI